LQLQVPTSLFRSFDGKQIRSFDPHYVKIDISNLCVLFVDEKGKVRASCFPLLGTKSIHDFLVEYLSVIEKAVSLNIKNALGSPMYSNVQFCFAVPHGRSQTGKEAFSIAAKTANIACADVDSGLTFVSEIEATVLYHVNEGKLDLPDGDVILVVDCGDDSINLASYKVRSTDQYLITFASPTRGLFG
jgi:hypothetical protein